MSNELYELRKIITRLAKLAEREKYSGFLPTFRMQFEKFCHVLSVVVDQIDENDLDQIISRTSIPLSMARNPEQLEALSNAIQDLKEIKKGDFWLSDGHISRLGAQLIQFLKEKKDKVVAIQSLFEYFSHLLIL